MTLDADKPQPKKTDPEAPEELVLQIVNPKTNEVMFTGDLSAKHFSSGSVGYFCAGKMKNKDEKYQVSCNTILIGSKPGEK